MNHSTPNLLLLGILIINLTFPFFTNAYRIGDAVGILLKTHTPSSGSATLEAYRHQLPRFGVSSKTRFDVSSLLLSDDIRLSNEDASTHSRHGNDKDNDAPSPNEEHLRLSLSFDEGFHHIPWLDVYNPSSTRYNNDPKVVLQILIITIVYSGSDGSIHAVHRETRYLDSPITTTNNKGRDDKGNDNGSSSGMPKSFTVEYIWVNEADVDVQGGLLAMFVVVLIVSLSSMVGACTSSGDEGGSQTIGGRKGKRLKEKHSSSSLGVGNSGGFAKRL
mmetsp:Transcript_31274/g.54379  ORF Transcript_31274/g.54379 Transcript_31274/m.54379 type:complete len:275 (+) Transcript_31274:81-905(+)